MGIFRSTDAGANWDHINNQINDYKVAGWNLALHPTNPDTIFFTTTRGVFRTYDAGNNWEHCSNGIPDSTAFWSIVIDPVNPNCLYIHHSSRGSIYRTMDSGDSWQDVSDGQFVERALAMASDPHLAGHVIVSCRFGRVYESFDYGDNWFEILNYYPTLYYIFGDIVFDPFTPGTIYGVIGAGHPLYDGIWRSVDNGQNWTKWDLNYPPYLTYDLKISSVVPSRLYAVVDHAGLFVSNDFGQTWNQENSGIENLDSYMITTIPDDGNERLYFCTNRGVYTTLLVTGISEELSEMPIKFKLKQNYPNPFNPATTIEFLIPKTELVSLKIYNTLGEEVATLVDKQLNFGKYEYVWDASVFASGIYYYKIEAGNFRQFKKMIFIK